MGSFVINGYKIVQGKSEFQRGFGRISAYEGADGKGPGGVHTGGNAPTVGRGNQPFGNAMKRSERQTTLPEFTKD